MQTPQEVYEQLEREGYRVKYYRVPLTDGTTPKVRSTTRKAACMERACRQGERAALGQIGDTRER